MNKDNNSETVKVTSSVTRKRISMRYKHTIRITSLFLCFAIIILEVRPAQAVQQNFTLLNAPKEIEGIINYSNLALKYMDNLEHLQKSSRRSLSQIESLEAEAKVLKNNFQRFQNQAKEYMEKLKKAGKWTKEIDALFEKNAKEKEINPKLIAMVKESGGYRAFYEKNLEKIIKIDAEVEFKDDLNTLSRMKSTSSFYSGSNSSLKRGFTSTPSKVIPSRTASFMFMRSRCVIHVIAALACIAAKQLGCAISQTATAASCILS